jgi:hypothetical protein
MYLQNTLINGAQSAANCSSQVFQEEGTIMWKIISTLAWSGQSSESTRWYANVTKKSRSRRA